MPGLREQLRRNLALKAPPLAVQEVEGADAAGQVLDQPGRRFRRVAHEVSGEDFHHRADEIDIDPCGALQRPPRT